MAKGVAVGSPQSAFDTRSHELGAGAALTPMTAEEATWAGTMCAGIEPWLGYVYTPGELIDFFATAEPGASRFSLRVGGVLAGVVVVRITWLRGPYVHMLAVAPGFQGRGLGSLILGWIDVEARRCGERNVWIAVSESNVGARRLYERHGFTVVASLAGLVRDDRVELLMRKALVACVD